MSDFCDPAFEICDAAPAETVEAPAEDLAEEWEPETVSVEQWNVLFGVQQSLLFYLGYKVYNWYPKFVEDNFADRDYDTPTYAYDLEWAEGTREIMAWTDVSDFLLWVNGGYWLLWLANVTLDNEGGRIHQLFSLAAKSSKLYPFLLAGLAYMVNISYYTCLEDENQEHTFVTADATGEAKWARRHFYYIYSTFSADELTEYHTEQTTRQMLLWVAITTSAMFNSYALPALQDKWEEEHARVEAEEDAEFEAAKAAAAEQ